MSPREYEYNLDWPLFGRSKFFLWILFAFVHGFMAFFVVFFSYTEIVNVKRERVYSRSWDEESLLVFTLLIQIVFLKVCISLNNVSKISILIFAVTIVLFYVMIWALSMRSLIGWAPDEFLSIYEVAYSNQMQLMVLLVTPFLVIVPDLMFLKRLDFVLLQGRMYIQRMKDDKRNKLAKANTDE